MRDLGDQIIAYYYLHKYANSQSLETIIEILNQNICFLSERKKGNAEMYIKSAYEVYKQHPFEARTQKEIGAFFKTIVKANNKMKRAG